MPSPAPAASRPYGAVGSSRKPPKLSVVRLLHPFPSLLVAGVTVVIAVLADRHAGVGFFARIGGGMLLFQFAIGIANDVVDLEDDARAKPWKPLPRRAVGRQAAVLLAAACAGGGLLLTSSLPAGAWLIGAAGLFCGLVYDVYFKRTPLSWLPFSLAVPLIPVWVYLSLGRWDGLLWWSFPLGALLGMALHFANQAPDTEADREAGISAATQRAGERKSRAVSVALFGAAASAAVLILLSRSPERAALAASDAAIVVLLSPRAPVFFGRDGLFGLLASASAVLAAIFLSAV